MPPLVIPNLQIRKPRHPELLKVPGLVSARAEASPGRQSNSRAGALKHDSILLPQQKGNHNEAICGLGNDSLFCPRLSVRGLRIPVVVLKTHLQILWCTSHQEMESVCLPLEPEGAFMILLTSDARLKKTLQIPFGSLPWDKILGNPELP